MARHLRRLTPWLLSGITALILLALGALASLRWLIDPNDYRAQIESRASSVIGRPVHLTGVLRWQLGRQIYIVSEGGEIANAAGFGPGPLARWTRIRFGVAARPLLRKRVFIDRVDIDGLQLQLQRNAEGRVNWELLGPGVEQSARQQVTVRIAAVAVRGALHYQDAGTGADWQLDAMDASAKLPEDLSAADREFRDVAVAGRLAGGPLSGEGVNVAAQAAVLRVSPQRLQMPMFTARWADTRLDGEVTAQLAGPAVTARLDLQAPSLRALLATVGIAPPPMQDPATLGALQSSLALDYANGAAMLADLSIALDGTRLTGSMSMPKLAPLALRFNLVADRVDLDRYREPAEVRSEPLELPLAWLKSLDARGTVRIRQAVVAGATAKDVRIDVE